MHKLKYYKGELFFQRNVDGQGGHPSRRTKCPKPNAAGLANRATAPSTGGYPPRLPAEQGVKRPRIQDSARRPGPPKGDPVSRATVLSAGGYPPCLAQSKASSVHTSGTAQGIRKGATIKRLLLQFATARIPINRATEPSTGGHPPSLQSRAGRQASTHPGQRRVSGALATQSSSKR